MPTLSAHISTTGSNVALNNKKDIYLDLALKRLVWRCSRKILLSRFFTLFIYLIIYVQLIDKYKLIITVLFSKMKNNQNK